MTLVNAANGQATLDAQPEAVKQAAVADRIVLTKSDLASSAQITELEARLRRCICRVPGSSAFSPPHGCCPACSAPWRAGSSTGTAAGMSWPAPIWCSRLDWCFCRYRPALSGLSAAWTVIGIGFGLYEAAFATVAGLYGRDARNASTGITLFAGFASTVGWPASALFIDTFGWRGTCLAWAALHIMLGLPLNRLLVPKAPPSVSEPAVQGDLAPAAVPWTMIVLAGVFGGVLVRRNRHGRASSPAA